MNSKKVVTSKCFLFFSCVLLPLRRFYRYGARIRNCINYLLFTCFLFPKISVLSIRPHHHRSIFIQCENVNYLFPRGLSFSSRVAGYNRFSRALPPTTPNMIVKTLYGFLFYFYFFFFIFIIFITISLMFTGRFVEIVGYPQAY